MSGPLEGIRVIDWTIHQQGPICGALLGSLGAEVIKLENRAGGDPGRAEYEQNVVPTTVEVPTEKNFYWEGHNYNKKGIAIDLKKQKGREIVYRLVAKSDVFLTNFRRDVPKRLGVDYETLCRYNPRIIFGLGSGFGPKGPDANSPCFDFTGMGRCGIMWAVGEPDMPPSVPEIGLADQMAGTMLALAIIAALVARDRLGIGQEVEASQLGSMMWLQGHDVNCCFVTGMEFPRKDRRKAKIPLWNHYQCGDGEWLILGMLQSDRYWSRFCRIMGIPELENDPRFHSHARRQENCQELIQILDKIFLTKPREEWLRLLRQEPDFIVSIINRISDLPHDPQVVANEYITELNHPRLGPTKFLGVPVHFSKTPGAVRLPAPEFGQHTDEVLRDICGYSPEEIEELRREEVIA